jgi:hypothetical protein
MLTITPPNQYMNYIITMYVIFILHYCLKKKKWQRKFLKLENKILLCFSASGIFWCKYMERSWRCKYIYIIPSRYSPSQNTEKPNNLKVSSSKKTKEPKASLNKTFLFLWPYIRGWHWICLLDHLVKNQVRFWYQCPSSIVCCPSPLTVFQIFPYVIDTGLVVVFILDNLKQ